MTALRPRWVDVRRRSCADGDNTCMPAPPAAFEQAAARGTIEEPADASRRVRNRIQRTGAPTQTRRTYSTPKGPAPPALDAGGVSIYVPHSIAAGPRMTAHAGRVQP